MAAKKGDAMDKVLVLRTCNADMTSYDGFKWPKKGPVECPDWMPTVKCGNGLHGLLWGEGAGSLLNWDEDAKWLVVEVLASDIIDLTPTGSMKCKFPRGMVKFCGTRQKATEYIAKHGGHCRVIVGHTATAGYRGTATAGYRGTATAGYGGTATAGYCGTATAGDYGTATAGDYGTATAGNHGTATAGYGGTATAGYGGTATAGYCGTATFFRWDGLRRRIVVAYVGENGIEPGVAYKLNEAGNVVRAG